MGFLDYLAAHSAALGAFLLGVGIAFAFAKIEVSENKKQELFWARCWWCSREDNTLHQISMLNDSLRKLNINKELHGKEVLETINEYHEWIEREHRDLNSNPFKGVRKIPSKEEYFYTTIYNYLVDKDSMRNEIGWLPLMQLAAYRGVNKTATNWITEELEKRI